jgi:hypothetical protein
MKQPKVNRPAGWISVFPSLIVDANNGVHKYIDSKTGEIVPVILSIHDLMSKCVLSKYRRSPKGKGVEAVVIEINDVHLNNPTVKTHPYAAVKNTMELNTDDSTFFFLLEGSFIYGRNGSAPDGFMFSTDNDNVYLTIWQSPIKKYYNIMLKTDNNVAITPMMGILPPGTGASIPNPPR